LKLSTKAFSIGLPGRMKRSCTPGRRLRRRGAVAEFRAVVHHEDRSQPDRFGDAIEDADDAQPRQRPVDFDRDVFAREVIDDIQCAEAAPIGERIRP
jgi:hypothetical protein